MCPDLLDHLTFTFEFHAINQIKECLAYYSQKIHPSSRIHIGAADHWEFSVGLSDYLCI